MHQQTMSFDCPAGAVDAALARTDTPDENQFRSSKSARQPRPRRQRLTDRELVTAGDAGRARAAVNRKADIEAARQLAIEIATGSPYGVVSAEDLAHELQCRHGLKSGRWVGNVWTRGEFEWTGAFVICRRPEGPGNRLRIWRLRDYRARTGRDPESLPPLGPGAVVDPWPPTRSATTPAATEKSTSCPSND